MFLILFYVSTNAGSVQRFHAELFEKNSNLKSPSRWPVVARQAEVGQTRMRQRKKFRRHGQIQQKMIVFSDLFAFVPTFVPVPGTIGLSDLSRARIRRDDGAPDCLIGITRLKGPNVAEEPAIILDSSLPVPPSTSAVGPILSHRFSKFPAGRGSTEW